MRSKKLSRIACLGLALFMAAFVVGCGNNRGQQGNQEVIITGLQNVYSVKQGDTGYNFLAGVTAAGGGKSVAVDADKSGVDFNAAGEYDVVFKAGETTLTRKARVYAPPDFYYNGGLMGAAISVSYSIAQSSGNFVSGVTAKDSFGVVLSVAKLSGSDDFNNLYGDYSVGYTAVDIAGNASEKTVIYTVSGENEPVGDIASFSFDMRDTEKTVKVDLSQATGVLLYAQGMLINPMRYEVKTDGLTIGNLALTGLETGANEFRLVTDKWFKIFTVTVTDTMAPDFSVDNMQGFEFDPGETAVLPLPARTTAQQYALSYELKKGGDGTGLAVLETGNTLTLVKSDGSGLDLGLYTLTVTATNSKGATSKDAFFRIANYTGSAKGVIIEFAIASDSDSLHGMQVFFAAPSLADNDAKYAPMLMYWCKNFQMFFMNIPNMSNGTVQAGIAYTKQGDFPNGSAFSFESAAFSGLGYTDSYPVYMAWADGPGVFTSPAAARKVKIEVENYNQVGGVYQNARMRYYHDVPADRSLPLQFTFEGLPALPTQGYAGIRLCSIGVPTITNFSVTPM